MPQGGQLHPAAAAARRRLEQLSRRPGRAERLGQGLLRPQADRPRSRRAVHAPGPRGDPRPGRRGRLQQLHQVLPGAARPVPLRQLPVGAAGNGAAAALVLRQPLRHVELDAHHRRAAQHLLGLQAGAPAAAGARASPSCSSNRRTRRCGRAQPTRRLLSWTNFFLGVDWLVQEGRAVAGADSPARRCNAAAPGCASTSRTATASAPSSRR